MKAPRLLSVTSSMLGVLILPLFCSAGTYHVWTDSPVDGPGTNWTTAFHEIQSAVNAAGNAGDRVLVTNGVYDTGGAVAPGSLLTNRIMATRAITVESVNGPDGTYILGQGPPGNAAVRCAYLADGATLSGFTLSNGSTFAEGDVYRDQSGGGAHAVNSSVKNCTLVGNWAGYGGGGVCYGSVSNCTIRGNTANSYGGGVFQSIAADCDISGNRANQGGGGTYNCTLRSCTIADNARYGAWFGSADNCTITGNLGGVGAAVVNNSFISHNSANGGAWVATLSNCIIVANIGTNGLAERTAGGA